MSLMPPRAGLASQPVSAITSVTGIESGRVCAM